MLLLAWLASLVSLAQSSEPLTDCDEINKYLPENRACRCHVTSFASPKGTDIHCHDTGMIEIAAAFKNLPSKAVVDKLWIYRSVVPILVQIENVEAKHVIIQTSQLRNFDEAKAFVGLRETVEILELHRNEITEISSVLRNMPKLKTLDLSENKITKISRDSLSQLESENLEFLSFRKNDLYEVEPGSFRIFKNLKRLDLGENNLYELQPEVFQGLGQLEHLNLGGNKLLDVHVSDLPNLQLLEVSRNNLTELNLTELPRLQKLMADNNRIPSLSALHLKHVTMLTNVNVDRNRIVTLDPTPVLEQLTSLRILSSTHNQITRIAPQALQSLKALHTLSLQQNQLETISGGTFAAQKELKNLYVQQNRITAIPRNAFQGLSGLSVLSVAHNVISEIDPMAFAGMESLKRLFINDNQLTALSNKSLGELENNLLILDVSDNPWTCDCDLAWMALWAKSGKIDLSMSNTQCEAPVQETMHKAFDSLHAVCAAGGDPGARRSKDEDNGWITALGIILAVLSLMVLGAIVALYLRDHHSARRIYALHKLHALSRVPSDMRLLMKPSASTSA